MSVHTSQYAGAGLVIAAILFVVGVVTVYQYRKRVKTSESMYTYTHRHTLNYQNNSTPGMNKNKPILFTIFLGCASATPVNRNNKCGDEEVSDASKSVCQLLSTNRN